MFPKATPALEEPMTLVEWINFIAALVLLVVFPAALILLIAGLVLSSLPLIGGSIACSLIIQNILAMAVFQYRGGRPI